MTTTETFPSQTVLESLERKGIDVNYYPNEPERFAVRTRFMTRIYYTEVQEDRVSLLAMADG